jgi:hypothetical protein
MILRYSKRNFEGSSGQTEGKASSRDITFFKRSWNAEKLPFARSFPPLPAPMATTRIPADAEFDDH